ncbi:ergosterol biosynthesis ERG4/ERG24 family-domain-containing protein [Jimgerdemannia flammicorona]|uniref:Ergosterol biosynthesis ERG4/ERG24 family-domain-containing protein n=1 Tax=Jimgerdemannia flammicorona TaxID=994334 RepID=A0A433DGD4_9FUNG|nr:ergosterol biosynthesis ERG4/ERG24 family-domain-containing protein [Jimgerdemannia flammicorona]
MQAAELVHRDFPMEITCDSRVLYFFLDTLRLLTMPPKKRQTATNPVPSPSPSPNTAEVEASPSGVINYEKLNPKTEHFEFLGPPGAAAMITFLPLLVWFLAFFCNEDGCPPKSIWSIGVEDLSRWFSLKFFLANMYDPTAYAAYLGFVLFLAGLYIVLPGEEIEGTLLRNGKRLKYKVNAFASLHLLIAMGFLNIRSSGFGPFLFIYDHWVGIVTAANIFSFIVSFYVYGSSFLPGKLLALGGNTGIWIYDFMIGRELNPRIGKFDIKYFIELRPGLIGWVTSNSAMAIKQYVSLGRVTNSMMLVNVFQAWYVIDSLYNEAAVLTTMDITTDGFGFMLAFGNLSWLPMVYSLQARYLAAFPRDLNYAELVGVIALQLTGYYIFRSSNGQKNKFRTDPEGDDVKHLEYIETTAGTRLLTSGWWGISRHINYLGDWLMSIAWCLPCGYATPIPYFYMIYFAILLLHRERRDDDKCRKKYGKDWDRYCEIVKWRIIPGKPCVFGGIFALVVAKCRGLQFSNWVRITISHTHPLCRHLLTNLEAKTPT